MHFLVGILLGLLFENAGIDGGKTINNIGFCIVTLVYLSYTSIMPAILKCKHRLNMATSCIIMCHINKDFIFN